ncbi:hypothetical protein BDR07DRAFT_1377241 [Suillus spraguei]|nr:hypothetical protein BDR07DRAFT_1377241 [Suillus spraguei]
MQSKGSALIIVGNLVIQKLGSQESQMVLMKRQMARGRRAWIVDIKTSACTRVELRVDYFEAIQVSNHAELSKKPGCIPTPRWTKFCIGFHLSIENVTAFRSYTDVGIAEAEMSLYGLNFEERSEQIMRS